MKILIVGSGGREHALAWKAIKSKGIEKVYVAPGNAGTALEQGVLNIDIKVDAIEALVEFSKKEGIDLTIIGPEAPLVDGIVDAFKKVNLKCFGPVKAAAQLEGSKVFTKDFLKRHGIPTAEYRVFTDIEAARAYILSHKLPVVIKADGLAAGKGVIIAKTHDDAIIAAKDMLSGTAFGEAGKRVIVEECIRGEEVSFIVMVDGKNVLPLATSQDHKAVYDEDQGPNTGGMGAYSPAPVLTDDLYKRVMKEVIEPTVKGMADEGTPYTGFLYAGLMVLSDGTPSVLEYNCRLGDPETQPILLRLKSDLVELCMATIEGSLDKVKAEWDQRAALGVVMTAGGYPEKYNKGDVISGLPEKEEVDIKVFHAGTAMKDGNVVTSGGRVLCVTALGNTVGEAQKKAYLVVNKIKWTNVYYRTDIGYRAVKREENRK
ncbi:MAG: phosphoribosylamine--glycine ligase [Desulfatiglans sp.]|jgi:phosphoribosylamine--glycine ligase|nr:phosphoribosylamine--glycine ligase [Desulfatiglans sp.]